MARARRHCSVALLAPLFGAAPAGAGVYHFAEIVDDGGTYSFFAPPAINDAGAVAFRADVDAGGQAIVSATPSETTPIADLDGPYSVFLAQVAIDDGGAVLFGGELDLPAGGSALSLGDGQSAAILFDRTGIFSTFGAPSMSGGGAVAFQASLDSGVTGIFVDGAAVADDTGPIDDLRSSIPDVNDLGEVAYFAESSTEGTGIFRGPDPQTDTVADASGPYAGFGQDVSINGSGTVAFVASLDGGGGGVFVGPDPATDAIADGSGAYGVLATPSINDAGTVAFGAQLDAGGHGIFTGPDPLADKVIAVGDPLFGSTVASVGFRSAGFNDSGDVAFSYQLTNLRRGIAIAFVPEPGEAAGSLAAAAALLGLHAFAHRKGSR